MSEEKDLFLKHFLTVLFVLVGGAFLYLIRDILLMVLVGILLMLVLNPAVSWLEKRRLPRAVGIILVYLLVLVVIGLLGFGLVPPLIQESTLLLESLKTGDSFNWQEFFLKERDCFLIALLGKVLVHFWARFPEEFGKPPVGC